MVSTSTDSGSLQRINYFKDDAQYAVETVLLFLLPHLILAVVIISKVVCYTTSIWMLQFET